MIHRFFSKRHQEEQFPFATSTHFSFFQAMISLSVIPCPRAPWQQGGARFLRKPHRCAKTIRLQQVHRSSMEAFHLRELRSFILNEVLYIFDIFILFYLRLVYQVVYLRWNPAEVSIHRGGDGTMTRSESVFGSRKRPFSDLC